MIMVLRLKYQRGNTMIKVNDETEKAYKSDGIHKTLTIKFPELGITINNTNIVKGSFKLSEGIQSGSDLECVGCISSSLQLKIYGLTDSVIKGTKIEAYIKANNTEEIPLFKGIVDSSKKEANRKFKTIKAYDYLYTLSDRDITDWYNGRSPMSITNLLITLLNYVGLAYEPSSVSKLVNGHHTAIFSSKRRVKDLSALKLLKNICQINGCFGRINRYGKFEILYLTINPFFNPSKLYPSKLVYPSINGIYPGENDGSQTEANILNFYEKIEYEDFVVRPIDKVVFRESLNDEYLMTYGDGDNKYIVQGNLFVYDMDSSTMQNMAQNLYNAIHGLYYTPFTSTNNGLPYMECGDSVVYTDITYNSIQSNSNKIQFYIFERTLSGDQFLRDSYQADGDEYQREFVTDISNSLEEIRNEAEHSYDYSGDIADLDSRLTDLENAEPVKPGQDHVWLISKEFLPPGWEFTDTVYFIGGTPGTNTGTGSGTGTGTGTGTGSGGTAK